MNKKPQKKSEEIRQFILGNVEEHSGDITIFTSEHFAISRQAVHRHIVKLIDAGLLNTSGNTRGKKYIPKPLAEFSIQLSIKNLEEDKIWRLQIRPLLNGVPVNVLSICQYGFTEMVNNVIDHSEGTTLTIILTRTYSLIEIIVMDDGVGIFNKLQRELNLDDPLHTVLELSKGKLTTDSQHHTGEGVFFTSRMFDQFWLMSGNLCFAHAYDQDWLLEEQKNSIKGTKVVLKINPKSSHTLQQIFNKFSSDDDQSFSKTNVPVFLAKYGDENLISRSQAKRLLMRFDRFKEIILNFKNVDSIGQAFADEIFRVFRSEHPGIHLIPINVNKTVQKMITRVTSELR